MTHLIPVKSVNHQSSKNCKESVSFLFVPSSYTIIFITIRQKENTIKYIFIQCFYSIDFFSLVFTY